MSKWAELEINGKMKRLVKKDTHVSEHDGAIVIRLGEVVLKIAPDFAKQISDTWQSWRGDMFI